jgi:hypothetical protein
LYLLLLLILPRTSGKSRQSDKEEVPDGLLVSLASKVDPMAVRTAAADIVSDQPSATDGAASHRQVAELHRYVNENITYVPDPTSTNYIASPDETLTTEAGDCDCQATLIASLIEAIGVSTRLVLCQSKSGSRHALAEVHMADSPNDIQSVNNELTNYYGSIGYSYSTYTYGYDIKNEEVWYLADTAMGRYVGDIQQLSENGYIHGPEPDGSWSWHDVEYYYP